MDESLLLPPSDSLPQGILTLSQKASSYIKQHTSWSLPYPLSLFINSESQEKWQIYENIFLSCLRTGDNESAEVYLRALKTRFGDENDRIMALHGLYMEAEATTPKDLENILGYYQAILKDDPATFTIRKRRAALLRSMGKIADAIAALTSLLDDSPTDAEAWSELGDLYFTQGLFEQAIFCLEEVLLMTPNAWNMQARLAEMVFLSAGRLEPGPEQIKTLSDSTRRFCRSVELCDNYLRGYYGLKLATDQLLISLSGAKKLQQNSSDSSNGDIQPPSVASVTKLNEVATAKLAEIVRRGSSEEKGWDGYDPSELTAVRELLDRGTQKIQR